MFVLKLYLLKLRKFDFMLSMFIYIFFTKKSAVLIAQLHDLSAVAMSRNSCTVHVTRDLFCAQIHNFGS